MAREVKILLGNCFLFSDIWKERQWLVDDIKTKINAPENGDIFSFKKKIEKRKSPVFFAHSGQRAKNFLSGNFSGENNQVLWNKSKKIKTIDGLVYKRWSTQKPYSQIARNYHKNYLRIGDIYNPAGLKERFSDWTASLFNGMPLSRAWNVSLAGAMIFGMLSMTMIHRYLGESVSARMQLANSSSGEQARQERVLGAEDFNDAINPDYITSILSEDAGEGLTQSEFEKKIQEMVKGYPIEEMVPFIAKQDRITAAFMIAIAKKESAWGKRVPVLNGQDCFNYWGFRAIRPRMGTGGHTCFDSPEDAVNSVAKRIDFLVSKEKLNTPEKMVVWKCGYDCSWDSKWAVKKWISDVDMYFHKLNEE